MTARTGPRSDLSCGRRLPARFDLEDLGLAPRQQLRELYAGQSGRPAYFAEPSTQVTSGPFDAVGHLAIESRTVFGCEFVVRDRMLPGGVAPPEEAGKFSGGVDAFEFVGHVVVVEMQNACPCVVEQPEVEVGQFCHRGVVSGEPADVLARFDVEAGDGVLPGDVVTQRFGDDADPLPFLALFGGGGDVAVPGGGERVVLLAAQIAGVEEVADRLGLLGDVVTVADLQLPGGVFEV